MADPDQILQQYGWGDPRVLEPEDYRQPRAPRQLGYMPPLPPRAELRNPAPRVADPLQPAYEGAASVINPAYIAEGSYGLGRTLGETGEHVFHGRYSPATMGAIEILAGLMPLPGARGKGKAHEPTSLRDPIGEPARGRAEAGGLRDPGGLRGGDRGLPSSGGADLAYTPVANQPRTVKIPGVGEIEARPIPQIEEAARDYMRSRGVTYRTPAELEKLDPDRARRIAEAYEYMQHNPSDPQVRRAYDAMIEETLGQYRELENKGLQFRFNEGGVDPYAASPAMGYPELRDRGTLSIFPTLEGYGSGVKLSREEIANNPLLADSGVTFAGKPATVNDIFRAVHDAYGHFGPGNPFFRAPGEERAWQYHSLMYSPEARKAMTTETRGQNSWLNFGPHAEHNAKASGADTLYADQKAGLLPPFAWEEGLPNKFKD